MATGTEPAGGSVPRDPLDERLRRTASLDPILNPRSIAVLGDASDGAPATILRTLADSGFSGKLFAVGLHEASCPQSVQVCERIAAAPSDTDLAIVTTPAERLLHELSACAAVGVKGAIVTLPCRSEEGSRGQLYSAIQQLLRGSRMRVLGPNCSVLMNPLISLNASCGAPLPLGGTIAFVSQSGALCHALLQWSLMQIIGFSAFVSVGGMLNVDWGDLIDYFGADPNTGSIIIFMESIGDARSFMSAAREVSLNKPIIVVKAGVSAAAARIIAAHAEASPGDDEVLDAAFRRVGVLRVHTIAELFSMADVLSKQPRPQGPRLGIVSNAAGLSAMAADSAASAGVELPALSAQSSDELAQLLHSQWRAENPVHVPAAAAPETYAGAAEIVLHDRNCDGLLLLIAPEGMADPARPAELLVDVKNPGRKPVLACMMGTASRAEEQHPLTRACIPTFENPHLAARAFGYMWQYAYNLRAIYETPIRRGDAVEQMMREVAVGAIGSARSSRRTQLSDFECKQLLGAYGIRMLDTATAASEEEAAQVAAEIGFPVALHIDGGEAAGLPALHLSLPDTESVRRAWRYMTASGLDESGATTSLSIRVHACIAADDNQLRISSRVDPQFGPVLLFGVGGTLADRLTDHTLALPPLNANLATRVIEQTRICAALKASKNRLFDMGSLVNALVRFSQLIIEQPRIKEITINPILLTSSGCMALHARIGLHGLDVSEAQLPRPAIRPYPIQYMSPWRTKRGDTVMIRPIQAEDEQLMIKFHERLSDRSVYLRYFQMVGLSQRTEHDRLTRICFIDYDREMALVAEHRDPVTEERRIVGLGNLNRVRARNEGEVAVIVSDDYQGHGLGTELMHRLVQIARAERMSCAVGSTMLENRPTIALLKRVGFDVKMNFEDHVVEAELKL